MSATNPENPATDGTPSPTSNDPVSLLKRGLEYYYHGENTEEDKTKGEKLVREAIERGVKKLAEQGNAEAQYNLGVYYLSGIDANRNYAEGVKWVRLAAERGHAEAQFTLGWSYLDRDSVDKDHTKAIKWWRRAAEQGYVDAQLNLGHHYDESANKDLHEAIRWYRKAAEAGNRDAACKLGKYYLAGMGVKKDEKHAVEWFRKAADKENDDAMYELGKCYLAGMGVEKDEKHAVEWFRKAAEDWRSTHNQTAMYELGKCYLEGIGVEKDEAQAVKWLCKAAGRGNTDAKELLQTLGTGDRHELLKNWDNYDAEELWQKLHPEEKAAHLYQLAAEAGDTYAMCRLAVYYLDRLVVHCCNEIDVEKDIAQAVQWYRKAAEAGNRDAAYELGKCYLAGMGVEKDEKHAVEWFRKAAEDWRSTHNQTAMYELGKCYLEGIGVEKDEAQAVEWLCAAADWGNTDAEELLQTLDPGKAVEWFRKAARSTYNQTAMYELGKCYLEGIGVEKDTVQAVEWFRKAAEGWSHAAEYELGKCYLEGIGVEKDTVQAVEWFRKAAEGWSHAAEYELGKCYLEGIGVEKDEAQAVEWLCRAADWGNTDAEELLQTLDPGKVVEWFRKGARSPYNQTATYKLGKCYLEGIGVEKDEARAVEWLCKAADWGNTDAKELLQTLDPGKAVEWFRKAAEGWSHAAEYELGKCYLEGIGVEKDEAQAVERLCKAADWGNTDAKELLQTLDPGKAVEWFRKAAEDWRSTHNQTAMYELGKCYLEGIGVEKDEKLAAKWLYKAADWGSTDAEELLQKLAPGKAAHLYQLAAEAGNTSETSNAYAMYRLAECILNGIREKKDEAQAKRWLRKAAIRGYAPARELLRRLK